MSRSTHCSQAKKPAAAEAARAAMRSPLAARPMAAAWETLAGDQQLQATLAGRLAQPHRCSCGGTCAKCSQEEDALRKLLPNRKSLEAEEDDEWHGPHRGCALAEWLTSHPTRENHRQPHQGAATIVCDGSGGYGVQLNSWAGAKCGIEDCVRKHEESHARDWAGRWPDGCKNADGTPKPAGSQIPLGGPGYDAFLKKSECDAYTTEVPCEEAALKNAGKDCKGYVQGVLDDTKKQQASYCGGGC